MLAVSLAEYLSARGLVSYDPDGAAGDCYLVSVPSIPAEVVVITPTGGPQPQYTDGYDFPTVQFRYRAGKDPRVAVARALAIYGALQSLDTVALDDGTWIVGCTALQSDPVYIGNDANERPEFTQNYQFTVRRATAHRE